MKYASRGLRRRRNTDQWEVTLTHTDPLTGEQLRSYHTVIGKTRRQAERARDELILEMELKGGAVGTSYTIREFMDAFLNYKEQSKTIERSTMRGYRAEARQISRYIGDVRLGELSIPDVNRMLSGMSEDGYAPKSISKPFRLLKQALKWAQAQDLVAKNPCEFCKPPRRTKPVINSLDREQRTRMLALARKSMGSPLGLAIELALTTGMRRGEVCALRWSDLGDDGTITVSRALGKAEGGFYVKEPKTESSRRTIPLTSQLYATLSAMKRDSERVLYEFGLPKSDPYILGTQEPESRPYNPTRLTKEFTSFCRMNNFECTFHDLRHTFATMMIASGCDVRTVASYMGHASVSMTLNTYADVDPDAKRAAVSKVEDSFDLDFYQADALPAGEPQEQRIVFTEEQLEAMLAQLRAGKAKGAAL